MTDESDDETNPETQDPDANTIADVDAEADMGDHPDANDDIAGEIAGGETNLGPAPEPDPEPQKQSEEDQHLDLEQFKNGVGKVAHSAIAAYCSVKGDNSQPPWDSLGTVVGENHNAASMLAMVEEGNAARKSTLDAVQYIMDNAQLEPEDMHVRWCEARLDAGWNVGPVKNVQAKEHPNLVPFAELSFEDQTKDAIFLNVVNAMLGRW